jgi:hypothetical protein
MCNSLAKYATSCKYCVIIKWMQTVGMFYCMDTHISVQNYDLIAICVIAHDDWHLSILSHPDGLDIYANTSLAVLCFTPVGWSYTTLWLPGGTAPQILTLDVTKFKCSQRLLTQNVSTWHYTSDPTTEVGCDTNAHPTSYGTPTGVPEVPQQPLPLLTPLCLFCL